MDYQEYKLMQLAGAILLGIAMIAANLEAIVGATVALITGFGILFTGVVGVWFNDD
ncbi:hypothetical protein [Noviherbaspirillum malthae]|uniref:hypothetical protein n=1 Tax=Noviherbaspirillum malthae TaxID=1260987 RepID=UPI00188E5BAC|nr:hypothetical protein [Noviherbaspirillum malthae]